MGKFWNDLTGGQKLMAIVIAIILLWLFWNTLKGAYRSASNTLQNSGEMAALSASGIKASYSPDEYKSMANKLYEAMDGWGTDSPAIFSIFGKLNNDVDFIKLDQAFGVREATDNMFGLYSAEDLEGWIVDDLSTSEITQLNSILKKRGITKRFDNGS